MSDTYEEALQRLKAAADEFGDAFIGALAESANRAAEILEELAEKMRQDDDSPTED